MTRLAPALAAALLAGCTVGPRYAEPLPPPSITAAAPIVGGPAAAGSPSAAAVTALATPDDWWRLYRDPELDRLVGRALAANTDLRQAAANLAEARALLLETRDARLPTTDINAGFTYNRSRGGGGTTVGATPGTGTGGGATDPGGGAGGGGAARPTGGGATENEVYDAGLDLVYEVDFYGRVRRLIEAARADVDAAAAARDFVAVTVVADTVRAYSDACAAGEQARIARAAAALQADTARRTARQVQLGIGNRLDSARAAAEADRTRAAIPPLEAARTAALARLAVLTGEPPFTGTEAVARCGRTPILAAALPVGDGAALLRRRPDIRQAERELGSQTARIGVATAELYPQITIGGGVGTTAFDAADLADDDSFRFSIGPFLRWSFPNQTAARARIRQEEARTVAALARFDGVVLSALEQTQAAVARYVRERDRYAALRSARDNAATAARLARLRFRGGVDSFFTVLDAERTLADNELQLAASGADVASFQVDLFQALGGGWAGADAAIPSTVQAVRAEIDRVDARARSVEATR